MSRAERLLDLIEEFRRRRHPVSGNELAQVMGISIRTLYRDIASLRAFGAQIEGEPGIGYILRAGFLLPPVMFSPQEVDALVLGTLWVADKADASLAEAARKAMARLTAIMPVELVDRVEAQYAIIGKNQNLGAENLDIPSIRQAIHKQHKLSIAYKDAEGKSSNRIIWPFMLIYFNGGRLISAWCELRNHIRHFRTDRIEKISVISERYPMQRQALLKLWREAETCAKLTK